MPGRWIAALLALAGIVLVSALPASTENDADPVCASPTATPEDLGPSMSPKDQARGYVCRENAETVGRRTDGD